MQEKMNNYARSEKIPAVRQKRKCINMQNRWIHKQEDSENSYFAKRYREKRWEYA